jgi:hypothetical protein
MVPRYAIEIGTSDIVVVAHVQAGARQRMTAAIGAAIRRAALRACAAIAAFKPRAAPPAPVRTAELYRFEPPRLSSRSRR